MKTDSEKLELLRGDVRIARAWTTIICSEIYTWNADLANGLVNGDSSTHTLTARTFDELCGQLAQVCPCKCLGCQIGKLNSDDLLEMYQRAKEADPLNRSTTEALVRVIHYK